MNWFALVTMNGVIGFVLGFALGWYGGRHGWPWIVAKVKGWFTKGSADVAALQGQIDALKAQLAGKAPPAA